MTRVPLLLAVAVVTLACTRREAPPGIGERLAEAHAAALRASPDGAFLAFLEACSPVQDRMVPAGTRVCELSVVPAAGGRPTRVASGVSTLGTGFGWSRDGHVLAALGRFDHATGQGELVAWSGGAPRVLWSRVSFFAVAPDGDRVGWISGGDLFVAAEPGGAPSAVAGADAVATFAFGARGGTPEALARRTARAGGALLAVRGLAATPISADVREYAFAPNGGRFAFTAGPTQTLTVSAPAGAPRTVPAVAVGREVQQFLFSPQGAGIAFLAGAVPGRQGDLWVATPPSEPVRLGRRAGEARWSRGGSRLAWLQDYDPRSRTGTLAVAGPTGPARTVASNVSDFDLTEDGGAIAYLVHETAGGYSVDLGLATLGPDAAEARVARGVFGFSFSPDGEWLYYRAACVREAEACDLLRVPVRPNPGATPERVAEGVKSFEFAPGRPGRLLVTWSRRDRVALDLGVWERGRLSAIDTVALPGTAQFVGADPTRVAYVVIDPRRAGVYVATVP